MNNDELQKCFMEPGQGLPPLRITDLNLDGGAVARFEERVIFLDRGLPGEEVLATVTETRGRIVRAVVTKTLAPSPHAVTPWCPHFSRCGGCFRQDFSPPELLEWKRRHVRETLARIGKTRLDIPPVVASPNVRNFRNKVTYAFAPGEDGSPLLGLRERGGRAVVEVTSCALQDDVAMRILEATRRHVRQSGLTAWEAPGTGYLRFLVVRTPRLRVEGRPQILVECITGPAAGQDAPRRAEAVHALGRELTETFGLSGFVHSERRHPADLAQGERVIRTLGSASVRESFGHITLTAPHGAFLQTNTEAAERLYALADEAAGLSGREFLWDLYCGVGSIGLYLGAKARAVHGFEIRRESVVAARANAAALGMSHCRFHDGDPARILSSVSPAPDVIVADPPRGGMDRRVVEMINSLPAKKLIYIACDIGSQARDVTRLAPAWNAVSAYPVDMFPCTPHVENLLVLERRG